MLLILRQICSPCKLLTLRIAATSQELNGCSLSFKGLRASLTSYATVQQLPSVLSVHSWLPVENNVPGSFLEGTECCPLDEQIHLQAA